MTTHRDSPLLRKYCVATDSTIFYVEEFLEPGRFLCQMLDHKGNPKGGQVMSTRQLEKMVLHNELRSARAKSAQIASYVNRGRATLGEKFYV